LLNKFSELRLKLTSSHATVSLVGWPAILLYAVPSRPLAMVVWHPVVLGGVIVSVLAIGPKIRGFEPGRGLWIFKCDKNPQHTFLRR
jgi:hypothetical protein